MGKPTMRTAQAARWAGIAMALAACLTPDRAGAAQGLPALLEARRFLDAPGGSESLDRAIRLLEAVPGGKDSAEVESLLAEAYYDRGNATDDRDQAEKTLDAAIAHADRALALAPGRVAARYWRAVAMLVKAGKLRGAESFGLVRRAVPDLEAVIAADPGMDAAGADRALGKVYLDSPWWFMGDTDKAIEHLEAARKRAPDSLQNRRFLAEAYVEDGREADALRELEGILNTPRRPDPSAADQRERELARRMAEKLRARLRKP